MSSWQKVFTDRLEYRADIVMAVLTDAGHQPVLINRKDSAYQWGHFEVLVAPSFVLKALKIIEDDIKFE